MNGCINDVILRDAIGMMRIFFCIINSLYKKCDLLNTKKPC